MEFNIKDRTHFLCITGSHAFGTATEHSDIDLSGYATPPIEYLLASYKNFEQNDQKYLPKDYPFNAEVTQYANTHELKLDPAKALDQNIYALKKFFSLASSCNPNIMSILFSNDADVLYSDEIADELRANKSAFLSAKVRHTYSGYAISQLKRIHTHRRWLLNPPDHMPTRSEFGLPEQSKVPADQRAAAEKLVEKLMREWLLQEAEIDRSVLFTIQQSLADFIATIDPAYQNLEETARTAAMKKLGMTDNYIQLLQAEKRYKARHTEWKQYETWVKTRNPARADLEARYGYDAKHAYHLVRLIRMAKEILLTGEVLVKRPDAAELSEIRNGSWTYDKLIAYSEEKDKELEEIYRGKKYVIPHTANVNFLGSLCTKLHQKVFASDARR